MLDLRQLRTLVAIRESGSLVEAANRLHLTQSALSHQLRDLEDGLGLPMLVRKSRPLRFTPAGERLLALAEEVLPAVRSAERDIARLRGGQAGRLTLAIECHSCFDWLMPALAQFRTHWPEVEQDFQSGFQADAQQQLLTRELDLVITADPGSQAGLCHVPLFAYESRLIVGKQHPLATRRCVDPADLANETLVCYPVPPERLDICRHFLLPAGQQPAAVRHCELTAMMVQLVASGRGVAALPNWVVHDYLQRDWIASLALGAQGVWCALHAAIRAEDRDLPYMADFLETARRYCLQYLPGVRAIG